MSNEHPNATRVARSRDLERLFNTISPSIICPAAAFDKKDRKVLLTIPICPGIVYRVSSEPLELKEARAAYFARWEAIEAAKAQDLAAMTEDRARQIIQWLGAVEGWRERSDWSGLVEQQDIFRKGRPS